MLASNPEDFAIKTLVYCQKNWYLMCCSFGINSQSKQHIVSPVKNLQNQCFPFSPLIGPLFPFSARCLSILLSWASRFALLRSSWINFKSYYRQVLKLNTQPPPCWPASAWTWSRHSQWCQPPLCPGWHRYMSFEWVIKRVVACNEKNALGAIVVSYFVTGPAGWIQFMGQNSWLHLRDL